MLSDGVRNVSDGIFAFHNLKTQTLVTCLRLPQPHDGDARADVFRITQAFETRHQEAGSFTFCPQTNKGRITTGDFSKAAANHDVYRDPEQVLQAGPLPWRPQESYTNIAGIFEEIGLDPSWLKHQTPEEDRVRDIVASLRSAPDTGNLKDGDYIGVITEPVNLSPWSRISITSSRVKVASDGHATFGHDPVAITLHGSSYTVESLSIENPWDPPVISPPVISPPVVSQRVVPHTQEDHSFLKQLARAGEAGWLMGNSVHLFLRLFTQRSG